MRLGLSERWKRLLLASGIALLAGMLLSVDAPEGGLTRKQLVRTAEGFCRDLVPENRAEFKKIAAENPVFLLQIMTK